MIFKNMWIWLIGSITTFTLLIRGLSFTKIRLNKQQAEVLYSLLKKQGWCFVFEQEIPDGVRLPAVFNTFCRLNKMHFWFHIEERMLKAGFTGTDSIAHISIVRWRSEKLLKIIKENSLVKGNKVPIYILQPWDAEKVGEITIPDKLSRPFIEDGTYIKISNEIIKIKSGKIDRTGIILYGPPGNGKSYLIRYFAMKFKLPLYIVSFNHDMDNHKIIRMFSHIKGPGILIFEDFDNYFDKRKCLMSDAKFTFDTLLNVLDGCFSSATGLVSFMTANDLSKIDDALKYRPSRFKYKIKIESPDMSFRRLILGHNIDHLNATKGFSLDDILLVDNMVTDGMSFKQAIKEISVRQTKIKKED